MPLTVFMALFWGACHISQCLPVMNCQWLSFLPKLHDEFLPGAMQAEDAAPSHVHRAVQYLQLCAMTGLATSW